MAHGKKPNPNFSSPRFFLRLLPLVFVVWATMFKAAAASEDVRVPRAPVFYQPKPKPAETQRGLISLETKEILEFFEMFEVKLGTVNFGRIVSILLNQKNDCVLDLRKCPVEKIPDVVAPGIYFPRMKIFYRAGPNPTPESLADTVSRFTKCLKVLGNMAAGSLILSGEGTWMNSATGLVMPDILSLRIGFEQVALVGLSPGLLEWALASLSTCPQGQMELILYKMDFVETLEILNCLCQKKITNLIIFDLINLKTLDCTVLRESRLEGTLSIYNVSLDIEVPDPVAKALSETCWVMVDMEEYLWLIVFGDAVCPVIIESLYLRNFPTLEYFECSIAALLFRRNMKTKNLELALASGSNGVLYPDNVLPLLNWCSSKDMGSLRHIHIKIVSGKLSKQLPVFMCKRPVNMENLPDLESITVMSIPWTLVKGYISSRRYSLIVDIPCSYTTRLNMDTITQATPDKLPNKDNSSQGCSVM
ncbi:hypothetical protein NEDG_01455 [Nematocida displodere]|uniref:Uncharacterized protein n=1 Tax=Nematocida displodere TaxID=1805483 RepID=A0A177EDL8_9MICR|nr:hypothetical protein NEDG_01455 [Nematocida displodere]